MKERILTLLAEYPTGLRKRTIASLLKVSVLDLITPISELEKEKRIVSKYHSDPANLEYYFTFMIA